MTVLRIPPLDASQGLDPLEPSTIRLAREAFRAIVELVEVRARVEVEVEQTRSTADDSADRDHLERRRALDEKFNIYVEEDRKADERKRREITDLAIAGEEAAKVEFARSSRKIATEFDAIREKAKNDHSLDRSKANSEFDSAEKEANARYAKGRRPVDDASKVAASMQARLAALYAEYKAFGLPEAPTIATRGAHKPDDPIDKAFDRLQKLEPNLTLLEGLVIPKAMVGRRPIRIFIVLFVLSVVPMLYLAGAAVGLPVAIGITAVGGFLLRMQLIKLARQQVGKLYYPLTQAIVDAEALIADNRAAVDARFKEEKQRNATRRDEMLAKAKSKQAKTIRDGEAARDERLRLINEVYARRKVETQTKLAMDMREAVDAFEQRKLELPGMLQAGVKKIEDHYQALKDKIRLNHESAWQAMATHWRAGMERASATIEAVRSEVHAIEPRWDDPSWSDRNPPTSTPSVLRHGEFKLDLATLPGGISTDPRLMDGFNTSYIVPALSPFPGRGNVLVETPPSGRSAALGVIQSTMFRLLTSLPPGQVRFTIVDPIGIGRNFGAFMHLADYEESLVNGQVWTDPRQVEERLADLSAHMEKVTQKYLRDEYSSIDEYNAVAGEVAEPYRVLVIADFPAAFDERSAARLAGIVASGIPCGVLTLIARDLDRPLPQGFSAEDLRSNAIVLDGRSDALVWPDPGFARYPLTLDTPPVGEVASRLIQRIGAEARAAKRVEVPFDFIAPAPDAWWTLDSRKGIDIPLGKAGATKRQNLSLGKGTSQHVLVAGRTGSGKSTLLHALIVNLALNYSPDEVELYLIDFKKGVEFKVYATYGLPHAAVVAIESEREFGISVLHRLDLEMRDRADRFRDAGVADVNGYRNVAGTPPLPRIMLIVDEFQEFFVEEDKLAQEAALLLDRLVRQGRAFGVHVHLGSQSLGGAYALARTTLGQFAVRIALQCSEADANLILSEHNSAAKLLSRPGEAIYNDQNGVIEGNHFFQVVWLSDERKESYLKQIRDLAIERKPISARIPIVFEGDSEADPSKNPKLLPLLESSTWARSPKSALAWLGDAVAIKDPTAAVFRRQGGHHLLIVGQNPEGALGIMAAALIGIAAQYPPAKQAEAGVELQATRHGARFAILDGTPEDDPRTEFLARVAVVLPHPVEIGGWRETARIVADLAEEVARRGQPDADEGPEIFLLIHDIGRFRDLRRRENDFGFGREGEEASPSDHLNAILREGSSLGVHLLIWSDNLNNLNRAFDNQAIREFESRVLFQMSSNDSAHLLDAPTASKLGPNRALFSSEEKNLLEKFRPYALPTDEWLEQLRSVFQRQVGNGS